MSFHPSSTARLTSLSTLALVFTFAFATSAAVRDASAQGVQLRRASLVAAEPAPQQNASGNRRLVRASLGVPAAGYSETPSGVSLHVGSGVAAGFVAGPSDQDGDGVVDSADNCLVVANPSQIDTDGDGCGNVCDGDYNQDGVPGGPDFALFAGTFGKSQGDAGYNPVVDCNGDGIVGGIDFACFSGALSSKMVGPSGRADRDPAVCQ